MTYFWFISCPLLGLILDLGRERRMKPPRESQFRSHWDSIVRPPLTWTTPMPRHHPPLACFHFSGLPVKTCDARQWTWQNSWPVRNFAFLGNGTETCVPWQFGLARRDLGSEAFGARRVRHSVHEFILSAILSLDNCLIFYFVRIGHDSSGVCLSTL